MDRSCAQGWRCKRGGGGAPSSVLLKQSALPGPMPQVWWKVAIVVGVLIIIFCVTAAMLFWDCCKLRSSWRAAVSLGMSWLCGHSNSTWWIHPCRRCWLNLPSKHALQAWLQRLITLLKRCYVLTALSAPLCSIPPRESVREGAKEELAKRKSKREGLSKDAQRRLAALGACGRVAGWVGCVW